LRIFSKSFHQKFIFHSLLQDHCHGAAPTVGPVVLSPLSR